MARIYHIPHAWATEADYIVYKVGTGVRVMDGKKGNVVFSGTDAATVIQQAIDALPAGGQIFIKAGTYEIGSKIVQPPDAPLTLAGERGTVLKATAPVVMIGQEVVGNYYMSFNNLTFDLNNIATRAWKDVGGSTNEIMLVNCRFINVPADQMAFQGNHTHSIVMGSLFERNSPSIADLLGYDGFHTTFLGNVFHNGYLGTGGSKHVAIIGNLFYQDEAGNDYFGVLLEQAYDKDICDITIANNTFYRAFPIHRSFVESTGVSKGIVVMGNTILEGGICLDGYPNVCEDITVVGNTLRDCWRWGIWVRNALAVVISNNVIDNTDMQNVDDWLFSGILLENIQGNVKVQNNIIRRTANLTYDTPFAIHFKGGTGSVDVHGNTFENMRIGAVYENPAPDGGINYRGNRGYITESSGTATIPSGSSSVTVNHGLAVAPGVVKLTGTHSEVANCWVTDVTDTQFTINAPAAVTADRAIYWNAEV